MTVEAIEKPKKSRTASPETTGDGFVRLHITPFDPELLKIVVPSTALPNVRNISYHSIETFPERRFGFIELPQMDADKIKKKLNGMVLKGSKMRIEKARPEKRVQAESTDDAGKSDKTSKARKGDDSSERPKKRKREMGVVDGVLLDDRKVKRGWTEPADHKNKNKSKDNAQDSKKAGKDIKRKQSRSKYIEKEECLLKTRMPPNEMRNLPEEDTNAKKKKKKSSTRQVTVHEFEKTTKFMSFLRSAAPETQSKAATEFIEGKGWVDEDGNVVEVVKEKEPRKPQSKKTKKPQTPPVEPESESETTSESETSSDDSSSEEESEDEPIEQMEKQKMKMLSDNKTKSSDSDPSDSDSDSSDESDDESETPVPEVSGSATSKPLKIDIPRHPTTPKAVHPLEALYKPPKPDENGTKTPGVEKTGGFSFFDADGNGDEEDDDTPTNGGVPSMPMTPYTKQDFEWRNVRSAAPTPDTVHPARMRSFFPADDDEMADAGQEEEGGYEEEEEGVYDDEAAGATSGQQATSDFQKWFWENRRDLNRSWMSRRKTAAKEKRHRENKARASKAA
ncbi:Nucleotide-binding, alpha-beta plait [Cordyceps fumosorosea ARSEF 2679]|uniref:Nucleotide-binding, alpha-beta plait n=1 Tax=Cordyceps fumosorosea (strain ARSEF 2679) TaxID=1081104 RepID=A0A168BU74_CORFA|nr:Nucleotide-binding, alpha-beta plait [Cordyceps fumosorosea ARSEF 2679]OAA70556.1 Nucleotide-binding, alpha-beta plait [Cordyceps fumosorosea ARSEF 2679]